MAADDKDRAQDGIAVVGIGLRFPGARTVEQFWRNLAGGVESIRDLTDDELAAAGVPTSSFRDARYVRRKGVLADADCFDARFFGISPLEASVMDPQHRVFLECAWEALENAGYGAEDRGGRVGVYTGVGINTYWLRYVANSASVIELLGGWQASILNDKDFVPTRASYHLDLKGPSVSVNSACSASLVAVHMACMSLLTCECDMALAGGVTVEVPQTEGVLWREGMVYSPDGHCRSFDASGGGIVDGNGVGIVVLKRLADALRDRDTIHGVILGSAVNNDGGARMGYTAPSIEGQVDVIRQALAMAGCSAETIGYVEAHGTATALGDPIEVAALTQAFRDTTSKSGFCRLGSVKSNLGHLDTAAGVAGLIKTLLCLEHASFVPSLHFVKANPHIDFDRSPFRVSTELSAWESGPTPRRAGVTSLGIGGTNAHVVVEEPPSRAPSERRRKFCILPLSAKSETALSSMRSNLARAIEAESFDIADVGYTLQLGRRAFEHRHVVLGTTREDVVAALSGGAPQREDGSREGARSPASAESPRAVSMFSGRASEKAPRVVFLFPGQGAQHAQMSRGIYDTEPVYRHEIDRAAEILRRRLDVDPRSWIFSTDAHGEAALRETRPAQLALFIVEYALTRLWASWGIVPDAMIGHSIGELVAACVAGVFELEDALTLVAARGTLMSETEKGVMLAVNLPASALADMLSGGLAIAAINEADWTVASGPASEVSVLETRLVAAGTDHRRLQTSHAFHSPAMDPAAERFVRHVADCKRAAPRVPFVSNVTGGFIESATATSPDYWGQHLRQTVRFSQGLSLLLADRTPTTFLEVGPGQTLSTMVKRHPERGEAVAVASLPHPSVRGSEERTLLEAVAKLWVRGHALAWKEFSAHEKLGRVPLPSYPFERQRHWLDRAEPIRQERAPEAGVRSQSAAARPELDTRTSAPREAQGGDSARAPDDRPLSTTYVAPSDDIERSLCAIWTELLGIQRIGIHDDFFDLGGHSLLATRFLVRLEERVGVRISIPEFFARPTVAELAVFCREAARVSSASDDISNLLSRLEAMSESDARAELEVDDGRASSVDSDPSSEK